MNCIEILQLLHTVQKTGKSHGAAQKGKMKKFLFATTLFICLYGGTSGSPASDTDPGIQQAGQSHRCPENGGFGQSLLIAPRVFISYTGKSGCWSEIRDVEIPVDFLKLREIAREEGDSVTQKYLSHDKLPDFFTWLLESDIYAMPGDALSGILGYMQSKDYDGLYRLFRLFTESRERGGRK